MENKMQKIKTPKLKIFLIIGCGFFVVLWFFLYMYDKKPINKFFNKAGDQTTTTLSLLNLNVPAKFSDACGFFADNCEGFNFRDGEFNWNKDASDFTDNSAHIVIIPGNYTNGSIMIKGEKKEILVVPYNWVWASGGYGAYVIKIDGQKLEVISRIDVGKSLPRDIEIRDNKIYFISRSMGNDYESQKICYLGDDQLANNILSCK